MYNYVRSFCQEITRDWVLCLNIAVQLENAQLSRVTAIQVVLQDLRAVGQSDAA